MKAPSHDPNAPPRGLLPDGEPQGLGALSAAYARALARISELERALEDLGARHDAQCAKCRAESAEKEDALADANVNSAMLLAQMEAREAAAQQQVGALAEATARSADALAEAEMEKETLERAHAALQDAHGKLEQSRAAAQATAQDQAVELDRLRAEFHAARTIQQLLLPKAAPRELDALEVAFTYVPPGPGAFGSTWVQLAPRHEGELSVLIGNVEGEGASKALMNAGASSLFSTMKAIISHRVDGDASKTTEDASVIRRCLASLVDPHNLLEVLDSVVADLGARQLFMPLFASVVSGKARRLRFTNAGHPVPLIVRSDNGAAGQQSMRIVSPEGQPLGSGARINPTAQIALQPHDLVVWHSASVVQTKGHDGQALGRQGLFNWVRNLWDQPVEDIERVLAARLSEFLGARDHHPDMAVVVSRVL